MSFLSCEEMLAAARSQKITLAEAVLRSDLDESRLTEEQSRAAMHQIRHIKAIIITVVHGSHPF